MDGLAKLTGIGRNSLDENFFEIISRLHAILEISDVKKKKKERCVFFLFYVDY